jgi:hypothetical protein
MNKGKQKKKKRGMRGEAPPIQKAVRGEKNADMDASRQHTTTPVYDNSADNDA